MAMASPRPVTRPSIPVSRMPCSGSAKVPPDRLAAPSTLGAPWRAVDPCVQGETASNALATRTERRVRHRRIGLARHLQRERSIQAQRDAPDRLQPRAQSSSNNGLEVASSPFSVPEALASITGRPAARVSAVERREMLTR